MAMEKHTIKKKKRKKEIVEKSQDSNSCLVGPKLKLLSVCSSIRIPSGRNTKSVLKLD